MHVSKKETSFNAKTFVKSTGKPAEQASSIAFTEMASKITPTSANKKLFCDVNFFILSIIFFLLVLSTTSHPESFWIIDFTNALIFINAPTKATNPIIILSIFDVDNNFVATPSHANINNKYTRADVTKNVTPKAHILFLFFMLNNIVIKNINTHIAHGLNPSIAPIIIDKIGKETLAGSISPNIVEILFISPFLILKFEISFPLIISYITS